MTSQSLEPVTLERINLLALQGYDKRDLIKDYHKWVKGERKEERREIKRINSRIFKSKNRLGCLILVYKDLLTIGDFKIVYQFTTTKKNYSKSISKKVI